MNYLERDKKYFAETYARQPIMIVSGHNATCKGADGKKYIDFTSGIGVNSLGFADNDWAYAVSQQAFKLNHISNLYHCDPTARLAEALVDSIGGEKVFLCNSGAEANECAIKTARKYSYDKYGAGRHNIITLEGSFHGRTMATLTATGQDAYHKYFDPFLNGFVYAPLNDAEAAVKLMDESVCAVMIELIQGEGGVITVDKAYLDEITKEAQSRDILVIIDEVQTGVGRTGKWLAADTFGAYWDIVTLAKGLGGGLPIGAALLGEKVSKTLTPSTHGTTFGGNPIVAAGALVVMKKMPAVMKDINEKSEKIKRTLSACGEVLSVSGTGLMLGVKLKNLKAADIVTKAREKGLLILTAKDKIRLLPPLTISDSELGDGLEILTGCLNKCKEES